MKECVWGECEKPINELISNILLKAENTADTILLILFYDEYVKIR